MASWCCVQDNYRIKLVSTGIWSQYQLWGCNIGDRSPSKIVHLSSKVVMSATCNMSCHDTTYYPLFHWDIFKSRRLVSTTCRTRRWHVVSSFVWYFQKICHQTTLPAKPVCQWCPTISRATTFWWLLLHHPQAPWMWVFPIGGGGGCYTDL